MRKEIMLKRLIVFGFLVSICFLAIGQPLTVTSLRVEYRVNPIGVDTKKPHFSWELLSKQQNVLQTAYRILVADDFSLIDKNTGNIWDSKKINSSASIQVSYNGKELQPAKQYYWKVMVWDNKGNVTAWSYNARWQMGLLSQADWHGASWIAYDILPDSLKIVPLAHGRGKREWGTRKDVLPMLRKEFRATKPIKNATAFICGLGQFELNINGQRVGDHFLDPGWTQ